MRQGAILAEKFVVEIGNDIAEIARVTALIERFSERYKLPQALAFHLQLAFDELLTNIISYGFLDGGRHKIAASLRFEGGAITAEIVDDGIAFDPLAQPMPNLDQTLEEREIGGLGIHFIRNVMDIVDYRRSDGLNHLTMVKKVPADTAD